MLTSSTLPTDLNINTWQTSSSTATSHTKTSLIPGNTPMSSGMKPPSNTINSNTTQFHYLSSAPKPPEHHHHPFPAPPPLTGKLPTSTPDTPALSATSPTFYDKAVSYPAHSTFPTIPDSLLKASALPTTNRQLHKNTHSLIVTLLAWGAATKYTSGGEEQAMTLLHDHHGAVFHQKGRCWVIHPDHAIVKGLAWSINSTPPDL